MRSHLDFAELIYDRPNNLNIRNKIQTYQRNTALVIIGAISVSQKERLKQELGFELFSLRQQLNNICAFHETSEKNPLAVFTNIPNDGNCQTRSSNNIKQTQREKCPYAEFFLSILSAFGLNTERYEVYVSIQSECGKTRIRKTPNTDTFYSVRVFVDQNMLQIFSLYNEEAEQVKFGNM